jgi:hypothetical protein
MRPVYCRGKHDQSSSRLLCECGDGRFNVVFAITKGHSCYFHTNLSAVFSTSRHTAANPLTLATNALSLALGRKDTGKAIEALYGHLCYTTRPTGRVLVFSF